MDGKSIFDFVYLFEKIGLTGNFAHWSSITLGLIIIGTVAWLADLITKKILLVVLQKIAKRTTTEWDDVLVEKKVFNKLAHIIPALIVSYAINLVLPEHPILLDLLQSSIKIYIIILVLLSIDAFLNSVQFIYNTLALSKNRPISGYIQVVKIIFYFVSIILIFSVVTGKTPKFFLAGLGTMAAVLLLVFKDTILGFVASVQLSANDMVRIGEWISMPSHGADGTVEEITLNTVKVQNWDKTISTIPTYALVSKSFNNWRGMEESGGRRIKRNIQIDMKSVKLCSDEMINKFAQITLLKPYIESKNIELKEYNEKHGIDNSVPINGRRMSNLGTFRSYLEVYLKQHPKINNDMTFLVRQLQPNEKGIPIEIYVFSNDTAWANYEAIQADIFDHILAILPEFDLAVFQNPTGDDFKNLLLK